MAQFSPDLFSTHTIRFPTFSYEHSSITSSQHSSFPPTKSSCEYVKHSNECQRATETFFTQSSRVHEVDYRTPRLSQALPAGRSLDCIISPVSLLINWSKLGRSSPSPYQTPCHISIPHSTPRLSQLIPDLLLGHVRPCLICPRVCCCVRVSPSADMLQFTPRHNGDRSPPVLSGTAADRSHSCLPALTAACVHQAPTSHFNAALWDNEQKAV